LNAAFAGLTAKKGCKNTSAIIAALGLISLLGVGLVLKKH
jgi:hypothetical protein